MSWPSNSPDINPIQQLWPHLENYYATASQYARIAGPVGECLTVDTSDYLSALWGVNTTPRARSFEGSHNVMALECRALELEVISFVDYPATMC